MKSAIYIADGVTQFVLTPETEIDKAVLDSIEENANVESFRGTAYTCHGGWIRFDTSGEYHMPQPSSDKSLIFKFTPRPAQCAHEWKIGETADICALCGIVSPRNSRIICSRCGYPWPHSLIGATCKLNDCNGKIVEESSVVDDTTRV